MSQPLLVSVLVVAWGDEPELGACLDSVLASEGVDVDVVVVDNGDRSGQLAAFASHPRVRTLTPGENLGFAAGCNLGAESARGSVLAFVNPDAIVTPSALAVLADALDQPGVGAATASVRLTTDPATINSAGNPVHYLGVAWAGGHGESAAAHATSGPVASVSGACFVMSTSWWRALGGFDPAYFAYHEDVELSLRCWQRGRSVVYVPTAIAYHHYEFSRNEVKLYLVERNRLLTVLTTYSGRTLLVLMIPLLAFEGAVLVKATSEGWLPAKLRGYRWLVHNAGHVWRRHQRIQGERVRSDRELGDVVCDPIYPRGRRTRGGPQDGQRSLSCGWSGIPAVGGMSALVRTLVVIPAFNEEESLPGVLAEVRSAMPSASILVVDDGSTDATSEVAARSGIDVVRLPFNLGVGGALRTGFRFAQRHGYEQMVQVDADGQHDPAEIPSLVEGSEQCGPGDRRAFRRRR